MYVASVTGTPENRHDHFELTVDIPPKLQELLGWPAVMNVADLMKALDLEWVWGHEPEYIVEYMFSDGSILKERPYVIDADGTLHVKIGVKGIDTQINAKAIGKNGSTFKNWIFSGSGYSTPKVSTVTLFMICGCAERAVIGHIIHNVFNYLTVGDFFGANKSIHNYTSNI